MLYKPLLTALLYAHGLLNKVLYEAENNCLEQWHLAQ